jgi:hypothetical protein
MAKLDTSFNFGFNVKPKRSKKTTGGGKKTRKRGRSSKKSRAYWSGQFGS